jgi:hypothetical protein
MAIQICDTSDILETYLGISAPTSAQEDLMDMIRTGLESSVKKYCRWPITQGTHTSYLPLQPQALGVVVPTAELYYNRPWPTGTRNRLQLPSMYVKSIGSIYENRQAMAGAGSTDFTTSAELLESGKDYFLEKDQGCDYSWSGGVIRMGIAWSSVPGTIKVTYTSGFTESELAGEMNSLRFALIKECADHYIRQMRLRQAFTTGLGAAAGTTDKSGLISRLHIGDFDVSLRDPLANGDEPNDPGSYGLSTRLREFLQNDGFVFCGVGV